MIEHKDRTHALLAQRPSFIIQDASQARTAESSSTPPDGSTREYKVLTVGGKGSGEVIAVQAKSAQVPRPPRSKTQQILPAPSQPVAVELPPAVQPAAAPVEVSGIQEVKVTRPAPPVDDPCRQGKVASDFYLAGKIYNRFI